MKKRFLLCAALLTSLAGGLAAQQMEYSIVPAMSSLKRLGNTEPVDGKKNGTLGFVMAQKELESASFVIRADRDMAKVTLKVSDLKNKKGNTIPASAVDLKVVKIWYQTGTAWHSYFADYTGKVLTPELLLNDETLLKVDTKTKDNYIRVINQAGKTEYVWISHPAELEVGFDTWKDRIEDAPTFQPFTLTKGEWKQIWVTVDAPAKAEGLYKGTITADANGKSIQIPVAVRVLPFELPAPMTNYDLNAIYYTSTFNCANLGRFVQASGDEELATARLRAMYNNYRRHNILHPIVPTARNSGYRGKVEEMDRLFKKQLQIYRECGLDTGTLFDAVRGIPDNGYLMHKDRTLPLADQKLPPYWETDVLAGKKMVEEVFSKDTMVYCFGWDEPTARRLRAERRPWIFLHDNGLKIFSSAHRGHLLHAGYNEDFVDCGGHFTKEEAAIWHYFGVKVTNYAAPHTGPENPDVVRRNHGMANYLADQDGTNNYMADGSQWNDFRGKVSNFRSFNWSYPGTVEPVNTIQFAGYREGIDDVKYATLLQQLARKAIATGDTEKVYAGKMALQYLVTLDPRRADLDSLRLEMINYIMRLRTMVK